MINKDRLVSTFLELVAIDSLTKQERQMADRLHAKLKELGYSPIEDDTAEAIGGNAGNIICRIPGNPRLQAVLLMAHMDTVVPGLGKRGIVDGDVIHTDGTTILGGDDLGGVSVILETITHLTEADIQHGDIYIAFTVAEEGGLFGAANLDTSAIPAKFAFILDDEGPIGTAAVKAPFYNRILATFFGKAAHAGLEPEKGISAIKMAAHAIAQMPYFGRIDAESTANIGMFHAGTARNIVTETAVVEGEVRSISQEKVTRFSNEILASFEKVALEQGGTVELVLDPMYPGYSLEKEDAIIQVLDRAAAAAGIPLNLHATGGGSDTNVINGKGIPAVDISVGMELVHSTNERILISNMMSAVKFLTEIICEASIS